MMPRKLSEIITGHVAQKAAEVDVTLIPGRTDQDNHVHALLAIEAQAGMRMPMQPASTTVLYGCKICSLVQDVTLIGTWNLEQVTRLHRHDTGELFDPERP
jgi:hypothetical protein